MKKMLNVLFLLLTPTMHVFANGDDITDEGTCTISSSQNDYVSAPSLVSIEGFLISGELCKHIVSFLPKDEQLMALYTITPLISADANDEGEIDLRNRLSGIFNLNEENTAYFDSKTRQLLIDPDHELVPLYNVKSLEFDIRPTSEEMILLSKKFPNVKKIHLGSMLYKMYSWERTDIIKTLKNFKDLQHLIAFGNKLLKEDAFYIAQLEKLQHLSIWQNNLGNEGAALIAQLPNLTYLDIRANNLDKEGIDSIAQLQNLIYLH